MAQAQARAKITPALLAQATGWKVVNAGIPGNTSAEGLERVPALLDAHKPKLLVVALGGNDFLAAFAN
ncbi:MAG: GDSL-type esterase/lipase family protein [Methylotenera sp.]|nr:GDSL-type esterase/lipase family protein [Methylotenera sp.]